MSQRTSARLAGLMFLFYIATAFAAMILFDQATGGEGTAARLASIARHTAYLRAAAVLSIITILDALVLAVALYALTRDFDRDLAVIALSCRIAEGVINAVPTMAMLALLWIATGPAAALAADATAANALGGALLKVQGWTTTVGGTVFAIGSTLYAYLFLRGRSIPAPLAVLGVLASVLLVVALPAQLARLITAPLTALIWIPMAAFEVILGLWLLFKGAAPNLNQPSTHAL
jgi:hypothetical protein